MQLITKKIKLSLAVFFIGTMAVLGVPVVQKEKIEQIIRANNQNIAAEVIQIKGDRQ